MGKRNKNRINMTAAGMVEITHSNTEDQDKVIQEDKQKEIRKNKPSVSSDIDASDKSKKIKIDTNQGLNAEHKNSEISDENYTQSTYKNKKKRRETEMVDINTQKVLNSSQDSCQLSKESVANEVPKRIKFGEDGEPEIDTLKNTKEKSYLNDEEKAIQDDDIDQFCNDIDDEDNKQYESWISLLEQKLGSTDNNSSNKKNRKKKKKTNKSTTQ